MVPEEVVQDSTFTRVAITFDDEDDDEEDDDNEGNDDIADVEGEGKLVKL